MVDTDFVQDTSDFSDGGWTSQEDQLHGAERQYSGFDDICLCVQSASVGGQERIVHDEKAGLPVENVERLARLRDVTVRSNREKPAITRR